MVNMTSHSESTLQNNQHVFTILVMVVTVLVGVPGNIMVIWITSCKMKWTVNTIWFWNLALADVTCCLFIPFSIAQFFSHEWLYGPVLCKVLPVIVILTMFASVFTLVVISIDRCVLVVQPVWAQRNRNQLMAWFLCAVIWILSFFMCLPAVLHRQTIFYNNTTNCIYGFNDEHVVNDNQDYEYGDSINYLQYSTTEEDIYQVHHLNVTITFTRMIFGFLIPLLIVSTNYVLLAIKVQKTQRFKVSRKTTKVVFGIVVAFFITWAPYHILGVILLYIQNPLTLTLDGLSVALAYFNSCINPMLYVFMGKDMKSRAQRSIHRLMQNAFTEEVPKSTVISRSKLTTEDSAAL